MIMKNIRIRFWNFLLSLFIAMIIALAGFSVMILTHEFTHVFDAKAKGMEPKAIAVDLEPGNGILAYTVIEKNVKGESLGEEIPNLVGFSFYVIFVLFASILIFSSVRLREDSL